MDSLSDYDAETFEISSYDLGAMLHELETLSTKELSEELAEVDRINGTVPVGQLRVLGDLRREVIRCLLIGMDPSPFIERVESEYPSA